MKNAIPVSIIALIIWFVSACSMSDSPKKVADKFLTSFNDRDFDEARKYSTPETNKLVDLMENLTNMAQSTDSVTPGDIEVLEERIEGDIAYVTFIEEGATENQELKLKKIDGKWMVHVTKEDIAAKDIDPEAGAEEEGYWSDEDTLEVIGDTLLTE